MGKQRVCGIYKIKNKVNGKCYIGQSVDIFSRWSQEKRGCINEYVVRSFNKYGLDNFEFSILKECKRDELNEWEIYFIKEYESTNESKGYNLDSGGLKGRTTKRNKKIIQYNITTGDIINTFKSVQEAAEILDYGRTNISSCLTGKTHTYMGYGWEYFENKDNRKTYTILPNDPYNPIDQIDLNTGNVIATYRSTVDAKEKTKMGRSISRCLNDEIKTAYGFGWVYSGETYKYLHDKSIDYYKKICQVNDCGEIVNIFDTVDKATKGKQGLRSDKIISCARKERNHTGGFYWFFHNELFDKDGKLNEEVLENFNYKKSGRRRVCQIDVKTNEVINTFDSVTEASIYMGSDKWNVSHSLGSENRLYKGYNWCYEDEKDKITPFKRSRTHKRKVFQINERGDVIAEYESVAQASRECGISAASISGVALGKSKSTKGTLWCYEEVA